MEIETTKGGTLKKEMVEKYKLSIPTLPVVPEPR